MTNNKLLLLPKSPATLTDNEEQCRIILTTLKENSKSFTEINGNLEIQLEGQTVILTKEMITNSTYLRAVLSSLMLLWVDHSKLLNTSTERLMNDLDQSDTLQ